jgi:hypothetical protein
LPIPSDQGGGTQIDYFCSIIEVNQQQTLNTDNPITDIDALVDKTAVISQTIDVQTNADADSLQSFNGSKTEKIMYFSPPYHEYIAMKLQIPMR